MTEGTLLCTRQSICAMLRRTMQRRVVGRLQIFVRFVSFLGSVPSIHNDLRAHVAFLYQLPALLIPEMLPESCHQDGSLKVDRLSDRNIGLLSPSSERKTCRRGSCVADVWYVAYFASRSAEPVPQLQHARNCWAYTTFDCKVLKAMAT